MATINPFYRFKQGWNAGFYPDNQIVSDLLGEVYANINGLLSGWVVVGTTKVDELFNTVYQYVETYNQSPYFGDIDVTLELNYPSTNSFRILIKNNDLFAVDNSQVLEISSTFLGLSLQIITAPPTLATFTSGTYVGNFEPPLITTEIDVKTALTNIKEVGSATFPITYLYDKNNNIAVSGLARGKNWQLDNGSINRFPAPIYSYQNQRTFVLPAKTPDDNFVLTIMERIIQASLIDSDYTNSIFATYNQFQLPGYWSKGIIHPPFVTYERVQITFVDSVRRKFILLGRKDTNWLWQRFVSDDLLSLPFDFLAAYTEATALPYEITQAGRWLYPSTIYDLEFVEFENECYDSKEFYPMPAKPGDVFQFNIHDGNLINNSAVDVGLFTESGQFIEKIGSANLLATPICPCVDCSLMVTKAMNETQFNNYLTALYELSDVVPGQTQVNFKFEFLINGVVQNPDQITGFNLPTAPYNFTYNDVYLISNQNGFTFDLEDGVYYWRFPVYDATCGATYQIKQWATWPNSEGWTILFISPIYECPTPQPIYEISQHQASVTIPSKDGCYRMGLYEIVEGSATPQTCDLSLHYLLENNVYASAHMDYFLALEDILLNSPTKYISFTYTGGPIYTYDLTQGIDPDVLAIWCAENIPGMISNANLDVIGWQWVVTVPCDTNGYTFSCYHSDVDGSPIATLFETPLFYCPCEPSCSVTLSDYFFDVPPIFNSLGDYPNEFIGIEIYQNTSPDPTNPTIYLYKRPIADFYIGPYNYDTGAIITWLRTIPGFSYHQGVTNIPQESYLYAWSGLVPCGVPVRGDLAIFDVNDNKLDIISSLVNINYDGDSQFSCSTSTLNSCCSCNGQGDSTLTYQMNVDTSWTWLQDLIDLDYKVFGIYLNYEGDANETIIQLYSFDLPQGTDLFHKQLVLTYLNTVPGLSVTYNLLANKLIFNWNTQIPCEQQVVMRFAGFEQNYDATQLMWTSQHVLVDCQINPGQNEWYAGLYSLSNIIRIDNSDCFSSIIQYWAESDAIAEGFEYYYDWFQQIRLGINGAGEKPVISESLYRQSNGVHRRPSNKQDLSIDLHTDFLDFETQCALVDATRHPNFVFNGQSLFVNGDIEVATIQDFSTQTSFEDLAQVKFSALIQGYQPKNSTCVNC
jgi:hypothetical protein